MKNDLSQIGIESVGFVAQTTRQLAEKKPELLNGTIEDFISQIILDLLSWYNNSEKQKLMSDFFIEIQNKRIAEKMVGSVALEPQIRLIDAGVHLRFVELWVHFSAMKLFGLGKIPTGEDLDNLAFICCLQMVNWAKAGYRMDWHPFDSTKEEIDPDAPLGSWTKNTNQNKKIISENQVEKVSMPIKKKWWKFRN